MAATAAGQTATIPSTHATTLSGAAVVLPDVLKGKVGVIVVGFSKASQTQASPWGHRLAADYKQDPAVAYFEIAMLAGAPRLLRGMIIHQIGSSLPEAERPHFLPLMENGQAWRTVAHYAKPDDAYILLVDSAGVVRWQTEGPITEGALGNLKQHVQDLRGQLASPHE